MNMRSDKDLENRDNWDFEHAEEGPPGKLPRAIVSVAFSRDDYGRVVEAARHAGKKTSEFIREAVLKRIESPNAVTLVRWGGTGVIMAAPVLSSVSVRAEARTEWIKVPSDSSE